MVLRREEKGYFSLLWFCGLFIMVSAPAALCGAFEGRFSLQPFFAAFSHLVNLEVGPVICSAH